MEYIRSFFGYDNKPISKHKSSRHPSSKRTTSRHRDKRNKSRSAKLTSGNDNDDSVFNYSTYFSLVPKDVLIYHAQFLQPMHLKNLELIPEYRSILNDVNGYLYRFYYQMYYHDKFKSETVQTHEDYCQEHGYSSIRHVVIYNEQLKDQQIKAVLLVMTSSCLNVVGFFIVLLSIIIYIIANIFR
jgi:hypothetical protein